jgi:hypothetical protein
MNGPAASATGSYIQERRQKRLAAAAMEKVKERTSSGKPVSRFAKKQEEQ